MPTTHLDYAPPLTKRQRYTRPVLLFLLVVTGLWAMFANRERFLLLYRELQYGAVRDQCLTYAPPKDQVVYEEDPTRAQALLMKPGYRTLAQSTDGGDGPIVGFMPECWRRVAPYTRASPAFSPGAVLFMHERKNPWGERKLIVVEAYAEPKGMQLIWDAIDLEAQTLSPRNGWGAGHGFKAYLGGEPNYPMDLRMFAGQADPADPTHFTLPFEFKGERGIIDVRITNDPSFPCRANYASFYEIARKRGVPGEINASTRGSGN